jgi:outer membrane lipoprotein-sorting protein
MRTFTAFAITLTLIVGCAHAQPATNPAQPAPPAPGAPTSLPAASNTLSPDSSVDQILDALDQRGKQLDDFTADVDLTDADAATGNDSKLIGQMKMQRLPEGDSRIRVIFDKKVVNDVTKADKSEYMLSKGWLIDRNYPDHREVRRQVLKPGQKMNLLKLGEGPFPLPLGQDKADVHRMFEVSKITASDGKENPPGTIHARLTPKEGTQFQTKFKTIDVWIDPASRMPVKIETKDPNEVATRTTELKNIRVNSKLTDEDFKLTPIDEKAWDIHEQPFED